MTLTTDGVLNVDISGATINVNISGQTVNFVQSPVSSTFTTGDVTFADASGGTQLPNVPCGLYFSSIPHGESFIVGTTSSPPYIDGGTPYNSIGTGFDATLMKLLGNMNRLRAMGGGAGPSSITYTAVG